MPYTRMTEVLVRIRTVILEWSLTALITVCAVNVCEASEEFPLKRFAAFTYVVDYEPFWSPDGRQIVLISSRHGGMKLHVMNADSESHGSDMRQLTFGNDEDDTPAWSPDGKKIAFVSIRAGVSQICVMNADGSEERQLTKGTAENIRPMWSADSARILFDTTYFTGATAADGQNAPSDNKVVGDKIDEQMDLATIRPDGSDLKRVTKGGGYTYASFSPDGMSILHRRIQGALSQIFVMKANGSEDHNLSGESTLDGWPAWSADGRRIVFSRRIKDAFQLFVMNRDGSGVRQLTDANGEFTNPRWSPDGKTILCTRRLGDIHLIMFAAPN
jgi:Tol biopolymer transport system component